MTMQVINWNMGGQIQTGGEGNSGFFSPDRIFLDQSVYSLIFAEDFLLGSFQLFLEIL